MQIGYYEGGKGLGQKRWAFEPLLFHSYAFLKNQFPDGNFCSFTLEDGRGVHAITHFQGKGEFVSQLKSPFGGLSGSQEVQPEDLKLLVAEVLRKLGNCPITIFLPFENYPHSHRQQYLSALTEAGFMLCYRDLHQYLPVLGEKQQYENLHLSQKRRLEKCRRAGFAFVQEKQEMMMEVHAFISKCRRGKELNINITEGELQRSLINLTCVYQAFTIRDGEEIIAACITSQVSAELLYYYLPASLSSYSSYSPMVMLLYELTNWARRRSVKLIDLGKSSLEGEEQQGLAAFKRRMGAKDGERLCLYWEGVPRISS